MLQRVRHLHHHPRVFITQLCVYIIHIHVRIQYIIMHNDVLTTTPLNPTSPRGPSGPAGPYTGLNKIVTQLMVISR